MVMRFAFDVSPDTQAYCEEVVYCLVTYCGKAEGHALSLVNRFWADENITQDNLVLHEEPYYWAMCIAHHPVLGDNQPEWWRNPKLSPTPKEALDHWHGRGRCSGGPPSD